MKYVIILIASLAFLASCQNSANEVTETYIHPCMEEVSSLYADSTAIVNVAFEKRKELLWAMPNSPERAKKFRALHKWHRSEHQRLFKAKKALMMKEYQLLLNQ